MYPYLLHQQISLLKKSFRQFNVEKLSKTFFANLFKANPSLEQLLPSDTKDLGMSIMSVIELTIYSFEAKRDNEFLLKEDIIIPLQNLMKNQEKNGIKKEHYLLASKVLVESMEEEYSEDFNHELKESWKRALDQLVSAMLENSKNKRNLLKQLLFQN